MNVDRAPHCQVGKGEAGVLGACLIEIGVRVEAFFVFARELI